MASAVSFEFKYHSSIGDFKSIYSTAQNTSAIKEFFTIVHLHFS